MFVRFYPLLVLIKFSLRFLPFSLLFYRVLCYGSANIMVNKDFHLLRRLYSLLQQMHTVGHSVIFSVWL